VQFVQAEATAGFIESSSGLGMIGQCSYCARMLGSLPGKQQCNAHQLAMSA
jgi:hypothetical protein